MKKQIDSDNFWLHLYEIYWDDISNYEKAIFNTSIEEFDKKELLVSLFSKKFDPNFILYSLLCNYKLWFSLTCEDWLKIIEKVFRENDKFIIENYGSYCDVIFLHRYLKIDSLSLLLKSNLSNEIKLEIFNVLLKLGNVMFFDESDEENFSDGTFKFFQKYLETHDKLLKEGCKATILKPSDFSSFIDGVIENLNNTKF